MTLALVLKESRKEPAPATPVVAPVSAARLLAKKAQALFEDPNVTRDDMQLAEDFCRQAVQAAPDDGEVWAVYSQLNSLFFRGGLDRTPERMEQARTQAERALKLAPTSSEAKFARASYLRGLDGPSLAEAEKLLRELSVATPRDHRVWISLGKVVWGALGASPNLARADEALQIFDRAAALPAGRAEALGQIGWLKLNLGRFAEAEKDLEMAAALQPRSSLENSLRGLLATFRGDLAAARLAYESLPEETQRSEGGIAIFADLSLRERQPGKALELLAGVTRDYISGPAFNGTTDGLRGYAYRMLGKSTAARSAWQSALKVVEQRLANNPRERNLLLERASLLALLDQREAAAAALGLFEEIYPPSAVGRLRFQSIPVHAQVDPPDRAVNLLVERCGGMPAGGLRTDYRFDSIKDHPRFRAVVASDLIEEPPAAVAPLPGADEKSVAVLAFADLSEKHDSEYFSDGISEELLNVLAKVPGLKVSARTSAFFFKGKEVPVPEIAKQLGVAYVVEGSVRKQGDKVRITAQLIKAADGFHVWSDTFTRDLKDIFMVQDEIAALIARNISPVLTHAAPASIREVNPEAFQAYLAGRALANKAGMANLQEAVARFGQAVELDPGYTAARVQQARAYIQLGRWGGMKPLAAWAAARAALAPALAAAPDAPDVLVAQGWILRTADWPWREAEQAFARALELRPNDTDVLASAAVLKLNMGKVDEAQALARRALELDPLNPATQFDLGMVYRFSDRLPEAERQFRRALELSPQGQRYRAFLSLVLTSLGRLAESETFAREETDELSRDYSLAWIAAQRDDLPGVRAIIRRMEQDRPRKENLADYNVYLASLYGVVGDLDRGMAELEIARAAHDPSISWLKVNYLVRSLRSHLRWEDFLRSVGLADDQLK